MFEHGEAEVMSASEIEIEDVTEEFEINE